MNADSPTEPGKDSVTPATRTIEIFSAGCPRCEDLIEDVRRASCPSCEITVRNMHDPEAADRAEELGVGSVPAVAIDGQLASCCKTQSPNMEILHQEGLGQPLS